MKPQFSYWTRLAFCLSLAGPSLVGAAELHVSPSGSDANTGTQTAMLKTISEAARRAQPGDTVTVHEGIYREAIHPPRGGTSDTMRIVYQAAPGENVVVKGSEVVTGWESVGNDTWRVTVPNASFGLFNPFNNLILADWFSPNGRDHHTGAVYLNGDWLVEGATKAEVLQSPSGTPKWFAEVAGGGNIMNVASLQPYSGSTPGTLVDASYYERASGVIMADATEPGDCIGWIEDGDWSRYQINFGAGADSIKIRAASATIGGSIEARLDGPTGPLLGSVAVPNTGGWQTWQTFTVNIPQTSGTRTVCLVYRSPNASTGLTTIWAQFPGKNPNEELTEINARQTVFAPENPGINFITVRGFTLEQAAPPWAPPTAEQLGIVSALWCKGWTIENNTIRYAVCSGVALGKYGDRWDNVATRLASNGAAPYVDAVQRALSNGWNKETIGSHIVRNNHISHCEQTAIVGSLGSAFSTIAGNHIHDIHVRRLFSGAEMSGIKFHGAIDTQIVGNHIHHCNRGVWLDWMSQGTRVGGCLMHDNNVSEDVFLEVNHGPTLIDHNILLSNRSIWDASEGVAYVHNLMAGAISTNADSRQTPYHSAHGTAIVNLSSIAGGDTRFYNNIFVGGASLAGYNNAARPTPMAGNVFLKGATASTRETSPLVLPNYDPAIKLRAAEKGYFLEMNTDTAWGTSQSRSLVTTALLGNAVVPNAPFEQPDGTPWLLDTDIFGREYASSPFPGPFATPQSGVNTWKVSAVSTKRTGLSKVMERIHLDINGGQVAGTAGNFTGTPASILGVAGDTWNYVTPQGSSSGSASLQNATGQSTTVGITWTSNHNSFDNSTPASAYRDLLGDYAYVFNGGGGQSSSTWTFTGLAPYSTYNLVIYAATGTAGGKWTVNGITKEAVPTASAVSLNEGQQYVRFENAKANGYGEISIAFAIRAGQTYGEMAAIEIETVSLANETSMKVSQSQFNNGEFEITATGLNPAGRYVLTRSDDLADDFPEVIGRAFSPTGDSVTVIDPAPSTTQAFYRIEEIP